MKILVTGTPGVGKTTLSKLLSQKYNLKHIDISSFVLEKELYSSYDVEADTHDFEIDVVADEIEENISKIKSSEYDGVIIDTHSPEICEYMNFDAILIIRCELKCLKKRLELRGYQNKKIMDNIECEIMESIMCDCEELFGDENFFCIGNTDKEISIEELMFQAEKILNSIKTSD